jgi:hypothetical protein
MLLPLLLLFSPIARAMMGPMFVKAENATAKPCSKGVTSVVTTNGTSIIFSSASARGQEEQNSWLFQPAIAPTQ